MNLGSLVILGKTHHNTALQFNIWAELTEQVLLSLLASYAMHNIPLGFRRTQPETMDRHPFPEHTRPPLRH